MSDRAEFLRRQNEAVAALAASVVRFPSLRWGAPVLLNSVFKSGTHLLRNILVHFCHAAGEFHDGFVFDHQIADVVRELDEGSPARFFAGHLAFIPTVIEHVKRFRQLLLYRDPRTWVLAAGRELYRPDQQTGMSHWVQSNCLPLGDWIELVITGGEFFGYRIEPLAQVYAARVLPWIPRAALVIRYEDLLLHVERIHTRAAEQFFFGILAACGIEPPADWRQRVEAGSSRTISVTDSALFMDPQLDCKELSKHQVALIEYAAPGLRAMLGYA